MESPHDGARGVVAFDLAKGRPLKFLPRNSKLPRIPSLRSATFIAAPMDAVHAERKKYLLRHESLHHRSPGGPELSPARPNFLFLRGGVALLWG